MSDLVPFLETMEHRWMRAWVQGDTRTIKKLTSRNFRLLIGSRPCVLLDAKSWTEAATSRYLCTSYRFGDMYVRKHGAIALFASQLDLEATMDGENWSGQFWVTDLWLRSSIRRSWRMVERILSRPEEDPRIPGAIRQLQLWR